MFQAVLGFYGMSEIGSIARSFSPTSLGIVTPGVNFINILSEAFMLIDPESVKKINNLTVIFTHFGSGRIKLLVKR